VTSARRERSSPSLSTLRSHPRHCSATLGTVTTSPTLWKRTGIGRHHNHRCTSYGLSLTPPSSRPADDGRTVNHYAITLEAAPVRAQDSPRRPAGARFARTTVNSATLLAMPSHVGKIVRHTCKLLSPWPIKGGAIPQPQGGQQRRSAYLHAFRPSPRYWHSPQSIPPRPGGPASSPASLVAPLC
jgi:hypothetical protein